MSFYKTNIKFSSKSASKTNFFITMTDRKSLKNNKNNIQKNINNPIMIKLKKDAKTSKNTFRPLYKNNDSTKSSIFLTNNTHYPQHPLKKYNPQTSPKVSTLNKINSYNNMHNTAYNKTFSNTNNIKIFENEDDFIRSLMMEFIPKQVEKKRRVRDEAKTRTLNKLYGIMNKQENNLNSAKKKKYLPLEQYQHNILYAFTENNNNIDHAGFIELVQSMKKIKEDTESISPLPPINIKSIYKHVFNKSKAKKKLKKMTLKEYLNRKEEPKDEYEQEKMLINRTNRNRCFFFRKRNKNFDLLPPHIKELFDKRLKK